MAVTGEIDSSHATIADNVQQAYLVKLKDAAKRLRQIEKDHIQKISKLYGVTGEVSLPEISDLDNKGESKEQLDHREQEQQLIEEISKTNPALANIKRQEIDGIVNQMNQLSDLFRDVSNLVVEQGTVLDRIDFHILDARGSVARGNRELQKIMDVENNVRVKAVQICLINWIVIMTFVLILKHGG